MFTKLFRFNDNAVLLGDIVNRILGGKFVLKARNLPPNKQNTNNGNSTQNLGSNSFGDLIARAKENNIPTTQVG
jgi:hypothetical protein